VSLDSPAGTLPVKLHRCRLEWLKTGPCWRVERALQEMGIDYELAPGPFRPSKREKMIDHTGQRLYPAIEFGDGNWYREDSKDMATTIRDGKLMERATRAAAAAELGSMPL
jgi:hypothetical protein